jgi:type II secretory pathway pseudopilin PulG
MRTSRKTAFTLIELLVVISIIIVLMGLLFPAFRGVQDQAKKVQAKNDLTQIVVAVTAFNSEYGRYPTAAAADAAATFGPGGTNPTSSLMNELRGMGSPAINTKQIAFFNPPPVKDPNNPRSGINSGGNYYDPWGSEYAVAMDADYDNQITPNPYGHNTGAGPTPLRQSVISWSVGKDKGKGTKGNGVFKNSDDIISWQ